MAGFTCDIVTPAALLASEEAELVVVPGIEGEMGFLKGHAPLVSVLADGEVRVKKPDSDDVQHYALQGGYVEVSGDKVIILADRALPKDAIDLAQVKAQLASLEEQLGNMTDEEIAKTTLTSDKSWCEAQIKATKSANLA